MSKEAQMKDHRFTLARLFSLCLCVAFVAAALPGGGRPAEAQQIPSTPASPSAAELYAPDQLLLRFRPGVSGQRADQILAERGLSRMHRIKALRVDVLRLPPGLSVERAVAIFSRHPEVEFAEPNYVLQALEISDQWGLEKVKAEEAWSWLGTGLPPVLLATVDTGIDRNHTDLSANMWTNPGEIADNGLDDDGNGYVDDTWGWDFVNGDNDPMDDMMHGTAVSSVSAGVLDGSGVSGICPWCQLMSVKVLNAQGSGLLATVAQGIVYAAGNGARVINLSLGAIAGATTLEDAVNYAWGQGVLVVAAAGNNGLQQLFYPAAYEHAMAVGSTNADDYRSCFSNYSANFISVTAPGEAILAAVPDQGYGTYSGTSLATPHVTGLAGLLLSQDPDRTADEVRSLIEQTAVDLGPVGLDGYFGWGRIDALRAVSGDTSPTTPPQALYTDDPTATGYAHARKLARDRFGTLHWVWHDQGDGQYKVLYATSSDDGKTWTSPEVVFSSPAETYHPALAVDDAHVYVAFPTMQGLSAYGVLFATKDLAGGTWAVSPSPILGGTYDAVRPDLHVDAATGDLHLVASSLDNARNVYHTWSDDGGAHWQPVNSIPLFFKSRYADVYAYDGQITVALRTVEFVLGLIPRFHLRTFRSSDGGLSWQGSIDLATHYGIAAGEYGASLAGQGSQLTLAYEHAGSIYVARSSDGLNWSDPADVLGTGAWPTLSQAADGQAWVLWDRSSNIVERHYTGSAWEAETVLGPGTYPNLKAGISGNVLEWVATRCSAPYCIAYASQSLGGNRPPVAGDVSKTIDEDPAAPDTWTPVVDDPDGDLLTCAIEAAPAHGTASVAEDCGSGTYQPEADYNGDDSFTYRTCDPGGLCDTGTVSYEILPVNDGPVPHFIFLCIVLNCDFDASGSYDPDGTIVAYDWEFGDGNTASGAAASHSYDAAGTYSVVLTVADNEDATDTESRDVTVSGPATVHVGDLDGSSADAPRARWEATVTITVHGSDEAPVSGALVEGSWSDGATGGASCTTGDDGQCSVSKGNLKSNVASVAFTVSNVTSDVGAYVAGDNHDPDGDSDGTTLTVEKPGANTPPSVAITEPLDGAAFESGATIAFAGTVTDAEEGDLTGSLVWTSDFDGQIGTGGSFTAALGTGVHTITATATDGAGASGSDSIRISVGVPLLFMHVGDLDGSFEVLPGGKWNATVDVLVHDEDEGSLAGAIVSGVWGGGAGGSGSCTTGFDGRCSITLESISKKASSVTFTVQDVSLPGYVYKSSENHDADGDSDGSFITIGP
jgi:subtilisin family serine protease